MRAALILAMMAQDIVSLQQQSGVTVSPMQGFGDNPSGPVANAKVSDGASAISFQAGGAAFRFIQYDFGSAKDITSVQAIDVYYGDGFGGNGTMTIRGSNDASSWTTLQTSVLAGGSGQNPALTAVGASYRYIDIGMTAFGQNGQLVIDCLDVKGS